MRTFVAIELPEAVRDSLRARMERGRETLPKARWVDADLLHVTLVFIGETAEPDLSALEVELSPAFSRRRAFDIDLRGGGTFPPKRSARVAWVGVRVGEALTELQSEVAGSVSRVLGRAAETRPFHAHVTLARCRQPWKRYAVSRYLDLMDDFSASFRVDTGVLMASELGGAGPRYNRVCTFALGGS